MHMLIWTCIEILRAKYRVIYQNSNIREIKHDLTKIHYLFVFQICLLANFLRVHFSLPFQPSSFIRYIENLNLSYITLSEKMSDHESFSTLDFRVEILGMDLK